MASTQTYRGNELTEIDRVALGRQSWSDRRRQGLYRKRRTLICMNHPPVSGGHDSDPWCTAGRRRSLQALLWCASNCVKLAIFPSTLATGTSAVGAHHGSNDRYPTPMSLSPGLKDWTGSRRTSKLLLKLLIDCDQPSQYSITRKLVNPYYVFHDGKVHLAQIRLTLLTLNLFCCQSMILWVATEVVNHYLGNSESYDSIQVATEGDRIQCLGGV